MQPDQRWPEGPEGQGEATPGPGEPADRHAHVPAADDSGVQPPASAPRPVTSRYGLHLLLFVLTVLTTLAVGAELVSNRSWIVASTDHARLGLADLALGLPYCVAFLTFLFCHEMGHYLLARRYGVSATLPYFIPVYVPLAGIQIGSFGAVIRIRETPRTTRQFFDIGIGGPLAGLVVAVMILVIGFTTLPEPDWILDIHPEYAKDFGRVPTEAETLAKYGAAVTDQGETVAVELPAIGTTLLYHLLEQTLADPDRLPTRLEIMHYPLLYAGFLGLFFTALNLLPIGQLDGGHVVYGLFGRQRAALISRVTVLVLILYGGLGLVDLRDPNWTLWALGYLLYLTLLTPRIFNTLSLPVVLGTALALMFVQQGVQWLYPELGTGMMISRLWLVYAFLGVRMIGLDHPPAQIEQPLDRKRKVLGWLAIACFVLCFTPTPVVIRTAAEVGGALEPAVEGILALLD